MLEEKYKSKINEQNHKMPGILIMIFVMFLSHLKRKKNHIHIILLHVFFNHRSLVGMT